MASPFDTDEMVDMQRAAARYNVPVPFLMAIIIRESSGDWAANGNRFPLVRPGTGGRILPYVGIFENTWSSRGCSGSAASAVGNRQKQVNCLARIARIFRNEAGSYGWAGAAAIHFSGNPNPNNGYCDENGMCVDEYVSMFMDDFRKFGGYTETPSDDLDDANMDIDFSWIGDSIRAFQWSFSAWFLAIVLVAIGVSLWLI